MMGGALDEVENTGESRERIGAGCSDCGIGNRESRRIIGIRLLDLFCGLEAAHLEEQLGAACTAAKRAENQILRWGFGAWAVQACKLGLWRPLQYQPSVMAV
jgi:hypothetical protein